MQRRHHLGTLADGGGDALHRAAAHVTDREDPAAAGLERVPLAGPGLGSRAYEALGVERDAPREPRGVRVGADEEEELRDLALALLAAVARAPADGFEAPVVAVERGDLGPHPHLDVRQPRA